MRTFDLFARAQDELLERLIAGEIPARRLPAAHRSHVARLVNAGLSQHEATAAFWDCVHTARATARLERSAAA